jgi:chemotaxis phosphatase CheX-like protein
VKLSQWLDAAALSARQVASSSLGATNLHWSGATSGNLPDGLCGIYVPLLTDGLALQLGVLATREVCARLASALIGADEGEVDGDADVFDALGEVVNLIAGDFKFRLTDEVAIRVGVPLAMKGRVFSLGGSLSIHGRLHLDGSEVWLVMTGSKTR